jgi:hypothetical protein
MALDGSRRGCSRKARLDRAYLYPCPFHPWCERVCSTSVMSEAPIEGPEGVVRRPSERESRWTDGPWARNLPKHSRIRPRAFEDSILRPRQFSVWSTPLGRGMSTAPDRADVVPGDVEAGSGFRLGEPVPCQSWGRFVRGPSTTSGRPSGDVPVRPTWLGLRR